MTVDQLIDILNTQDHDKEVVMRRTDHDNLYIPINSVTISLNKDGKVFFIGLNP